VDLVLGDPGIEEDLAARPVIREGEGVSAPVASPEDIVAMKVFAGRPKNLEDALAVVSAQGASLDLEIARGVLQTLEQALDRRDLLSRLDALTHRQ
jgi:hypothetical protein